MALPLNIDWLKNFILTLPALPRNSIGLNTASIQDLESKINEAAMQLKNIRDCGGIGGLDDGEYSRLHNALVQYQQRLRSYSSPLHRCPPNVLANILEHYSPSTQVDDFCPNIYDPIPNIQCPLLTVMTRVSFRLYCEVTGNPRLFSNIRLRRKAHCGEHHPVVREHITKLLELAGSHQLHVIIEFIEPYAVPSHFHPDAVKDRISGCPSMVQLKSKPWRAFTYLGASSPWVATILDDKAMFPDPITHSTTILEMTPHNPGLPRHP
ncbi:hypothetical protein VNI00_008673 [Paramarasmius palmivorus]|uniref:Uncharacterized protein n=1 Tax=Paramarasmius palmivorus TaxID=297713 RepID=A0AAW0CT61_9AGAR